MGVSRRHRDAYAELVKEFLEPRHAQVIGCEIMEGRRDPEIRELRRKFR